jgi:hypothetical protein
VRISAHTQTELIVLRLMVKLIQSWLWTHGAPQFFRVRLWDVSANSTSIQTASFVTLIELINLVIATIKSIPNL